MRGKTTYTAKYNIYFSYWLELSLFSFSGLHPAGQNISPLIEKEEIGKEHRDTTI